MTAGDRPGPQGVLRAFALVALIMAWHAASDRISDHFGVETESFSSPWKYVLIGFGLLVTCGGIVGLGCVRGGKTSLRGLGWRFDHPARFVALGLVLTALLIGLVVGIYAAMGGAAGVRELGTNLANMTGAQRTFFAVMGARNAFVEETLFRGDLQGTLTPKLGRVGAVVVTAATFALFHRTLSPIPLEMKFVMGLLFSSSTAWTGSLVPSAIAHTLLWAIIADN